MPTREIKPEMFKGITFLRKEMPGLSVNKYRIYTDHSNYTVVEAENAKAALEKSGVENPLRVLHDSIYLDNVVKLDDPAKEKTQEKAPEKPGENTPVTAEPVTAEPETDAPTVALENTSDTPENTTDTPEDNHPPSDIAAANAALTSEDVDKLLNT